jgi:serine/threonine-protein kinase RsbT
MLTSRSETVTVQSSPEVVSVRHLVRRYAVELGFSLIEQTKIVTAASELARNTVDYGGGGTMTIEIVEDGVRKGVRLTFEDRGPGIADISLALRDGYTTGSGMGLGLGGAKRLSNQFEIDSEPGRGTRVAITRWKGAA